MSLDTEAPDDHQHPPHGMLQIVPIPPCRTQPDLARAYTAGVTAPCRAGVRDSDAAIPYAVRRNLVAIITSGTRVPGLGNSGPRAGRPGLEGNAPAGARIVFCGAGAAGTRGHGARLDRRSTGAVRWCGWPSSRLRDRGPGKD